MRVRRREEAAVWALVLALVVLVGLGAAGFWFASGLVDAEGDGGAAEGAAEGAAPASGPRVAGGGSARGSGAPKPEATPAADDPLLERVVGTGGVQITLRVSRVASMVHLLDRAAHDGPRNPQRVRWQEIAREAGLDDTLLERWRAHFGLAGSAAREDADGYFRPDTGDWARALAVLHTVDRTEDIAEALAGVGADAGQEIERSLRVLEPAFVPYHRSGYSLLVARVEKLEALYGSPAVLGALEEARACFGVTEPVAFTLNAVYREEGVGQMYRVPRYPGVVVWPLRTKAMSNYAAFEMLEFGLDDSPMTRSPRRFSLPTGVPGEAPEFRGAGLIGPLALGWAVAAWNPSDPLVFSRAKTCFKCDQATREKHARLAKQGAALRDLCRAERPPAAQ